MIFLADYPVLRSLAWHVTGTDSLDDADAFSLYERNWAYVRLEDLSDHERAVIADLTRRFGNGVFMPNGGPPVQLPGVHCV